MAKISLDGSAITDWDSFHSACAQAFGFPDFYGRNMDAWIDCLSYLRDDDGMSAIRLSANDRLCIEVLHAEQLRQQAPEILAELTFCVAIVNERYEDYGEAPALELQLH